MGAPSSAGGFFLLRIIEQCYLPASNSVIRSYRTALFVPIEQRYSVTSDSTIQSHRTALFGWSVRIIGADPPAVSIEMIYGSVKTLSPI